MIVGFVGLGAMGGAIASRLAAGGHRMVVHDKSPERAKLFEGRAQIVESSQVLADAADVVFSCLTSPQTYEEAVFGSQGLLAGSRMKTYIHVGTSESTLLERLEATFAKRGVETLDAPVTGGVARGVDGTLTVMVAGKRRVFDDMMPLFRNYGTKVVHVSDRVGAAQRLKHVNSMLSAANLAIACEALLVAHKAGLSLEATLDVLNNGTGQSIATLDKIPKQVFTRAFNHGGAIELMIKDIRAFIGAAHDFEVPAPMCEAVVSAFVKAADELGGGADVTAVMRSIERAAGFELPAVRPAATRA